MIVNIAHKMAGLGVEFMLTSINVKTNWFDLVADVDNDDDVRLVVSGVVVAVVGDGGG